MLVRMHMETFQVFEFRNVVPHANSAKFSEISKKGQTKYLRPNHFRKLPDFRNLATEGQVPNPALPISVVFQRESNAVVWML